MKFAFPSFSGAAAKKAVTSLDQRSKMMAYDQPLVWVVVLLMSVSYTHLTLPTKRIV